jgi:hypothetical protein
MNDEKKTATEHIAETKNRAERLLALLNAPQPELITWVEAVGRMCKEIGACAAPDSESADRVLACAYVRAVLEGRPDSADLYPDWEDVRAHARCMLADSELRGQELIDKLDGLDALLHRRGHYECTDDD